MGYTSPMSVEFFQHIQYIAHIGYLICLLVLPAISMSYTGLITSQYIEIHVNEDSAMLIGKVPIFNVLCENNTN